MTLLRKLHSTHGDPTKVLELLYPGDSPGIVDVRQRCLDLCGDHTAKAAIIIGPIGSGKSTLARIVALCRYLVLLKPDAQEKLIRSVSLAPDGLLNDKSLDWFVETSVTGLVLSLANSQLFGIEEGAATGVAERPGVFEIATVGRMRADDPTDGARATGGVVFLDEIGDLDPGLQPKLLTVLSGGRVHRVGGEYKEGYTFEGLTICATWKDVFSADVLREDLLSRMAAHIIRIPPLSERGDDIVQIAARVHSQHKESMVRSYESLQSRGVRGLDHEKINSSISATRSLELSEQDFEVLRTIQWENYGDLRGMSQAINRAVRHRCDIRSAMDTAVPVRRSHTSIDVVVSALAEYALSTEPAGRSLTGIVKSFFDRCRHALHGQISSNRYLRDLMVRHLGVDPKKFSDDLRNLVRSRTAEENDE